MSHPKKSDQRTPDKWNYSGASNEGIDNPSDPEVARAECHRWYYMIYPPSSVHVSDGADCDWPSEYDEPLNGHDREADAMLRAMYRRLLHVRRR